MAQKPWEKYQQQQAGPWQNYATGPVDSTSPSAPPPPTADFSKSAWGVAGEQAADVGRGIRDFIPNTVKFLAHAGKETLMGRGAQLAPQILEGLNTGIVQPLATIGKGAIELASPGIVSALPPQAPEWSQAAQASGANLAGTVAPKIPVKAPIRSALRTVTSPEALEARAASNVARALGPKGAEAQSTAAKISPELSQQYAIRGLRQKTIDANLKADLDLAGRNVQEMENYIVDNQVGQPVPRTELLKEVDDAIAALSVEGTGISFADDALRELAKQRAKLSQLPDDVPFKTLISARRQLDNEVNRAGGFKSATSPKEGTKIQIKRSIADMFRRRVNSFHEALEQANHEFWLKRKAVDIAQARQLGEVGQVGAELPGRGTLLDDMIATGLGGMIGGRTGAVFGEALNIGRQLPGYSGLKARTQQSTANFMREIPAQAPRPFPSNPRIGDKFLQQGKLLTFTTEGWR